MLKKIFEFIKYLLSFLSKKEEVAIDDGTTETTEPSIEVEDDTDTADDVQSASTESVVIENEQSGFVSDFKILVDNGHGDNTPGKRSPWSAHGVEPKLDFYEYKWNREISVPIVEELRKRGYDAEILVPEITDISLTERYQRVNKVCKDLGANKVILVSIHSNAAGRGDKWMTAQGWSAFTTKGNTKSDTLAEFLYDEAEKNFEGRKIRKENSDGDRDWESNFTIIYKSLCPAVLTENFFYDNEDDVKYILSEEGRNAVIKTHVDGIINYIKSTEK